MARTIQWDIILKSIYIKKKYKQIVIVIVINKNNNNIENKNLIELKRKE
jgi:hypothetical protein